jgi:hypothetical protein
VAVEGLNFARTWYGANKQARFPLLLAIFDRQSGKKPTWRLGN